MGFVLLRMHGVSLFMVALWNILITRDGGVGGRASGLQRGFSPSCLGYDS